MNTKKLAISIISSLILIVPAANLVKAQVPAVPKPTCVDVPGIPCPKDLETNIKTERQVPGPSEENEAKKQLDQISKNLKKLIEEIMLGIIRTVESAWERLEGIFNNWRK